MFIYSQSTGLMLHSASNMRAQGYSGLAPYKNAPGAQSIHGAGPIPRGEWNIVGEIDAADTGPFSLLLSPAPGTVTFGRTGFRIHGDSVTHPGAASHGCIVLARPFRDDIWDSGDRALTVIA